MTPEEVALAGLRAAEESTRAAWVSAYSTAAQAVLSVAAIFFSVWIAVQAERRATARERVTNAKAEARIRKAENAPMIRNLENIEHHLKEVSKLAESGASAGREAEEGHPGHVDVFKDKQHDLRRWIDRFRNAIKRLDDPILESIFDGFIQFLNKYEKTIFTENLRTSRGSMEALHYNAIDLLKTIREIIDQAKSDSIANEKD